MQIPLNWWFSHSLDTSVVHSFFSKHQKTKTKTRKADELFCSEYIFSRCNYNQAIPIKWFGSPRQTNPGGAKKKRNCCMPAFLGFFQVYLVQLKTRSVYLRFTRKVWKLTNESYENASSSYISLTKNNNLFVTERERRIGEYWSEVVAVRTSLRSVRTKRPRANIPQYGSS